jgi:Nitrile hydratase beta subunit
MTTAPERTYPILMKTLADIGERGDTSLRCIEHEPEVWESRIQVTSECLSSAGVLPNLERRHAEDRLGESIYAKFPVQARSALTVAHLLMEKEVFTEEELQLKMTEVRERMEE